MALPQTFTTASPLLANYSYTDIASGTGYVKYYLFSQKDSVGETYHLSENTIYSDSIYLNAYWSGSSQSETKLLDTDFDLTTYKIPTSIKGTATLNIPYIFNRGSSANSKSTYLLVKIRKWDGATETEISSVQTETLSGGAGIVSGVFSLNMDVAKTNFAEGDTLRVTVEIWGWIPGINSSDGNMYYGISPNDETFTISTETCKSAVSLINIPNEINL